MGRHVSQNKTMTMKRTQRVRPVPVALAVFAGYLSLSVATIGFGAVAGFMAAQMQPRLIPTAG
jgi:hypothetical protein